MSNLYKVSWDSLSLPGFASIPKHVYVSTSDAANQWAGRCIEAGKFNVAIEGPKPDNCDLAIGRMNAYTRAARGIKSY